MNYTHLSILERACILRLAKGIKREQQRTLERVLSQGKKSLKSK